jgi:hypothetical protein
MSNTDGASETYAQLLLEERLGYPLWYPDLDHNLPQTYRDQGIGIGDVGKITGAGQFRYYFNVHGNNPIPQRHARISLQPWEQQDTSYFPDMRPPGTIIKRGSVTKISLVSDVLIP